ncbi:peptidoglycan-binding protein [Streptomyces sp. NPDC001177]
MSDDRTGADSASLGLEDTRRLTAVEPEGDGPSRPFEPGDGMVTEPAVQEPMTASKSRRRRRAAVGLTLAILATGGAATGAALWSDSGAEHPGATPKKAKTVTVDRTTLSDNLTLPGTLGYGTPRTLHPYGSGRVTWLPALGATIKRGQTIWRVDDRPVLLLNGDTPVFRPLDRVGLVGRDVRVVADHLRSLGYDIGVQPAEGTWVHSPAPSPSGQSAGKGDPAAPQPSSGPSPSASSGGSKSQAPAGQAVPSSSLTKVRKGDAVLTRSLIAAIKRWQRSQDVEPSGVIQPGDVFVTSESVRVGKVLAQVGDDANTGLLSVTSTRKQITVSVDPSDAGSIRQDARVRVTLPDDRQVNGTVASIGTVVQSDEADNSAQSGPAGRLTVTVRLDGDGEALRLDSAAVKAEFPGRIKRNVLAVPVGALLALSEGGYALKTADGHLVAVTTGMFARGMVEVTGSGLRAGLRVETAS